MLGEVLPDELTRLGCPQGTARIQLRCRTEAATVRCPSAFGSFWFIFLATGSVFGVRKTEGYVSMAVYGLVQ